MLRPYPFLLLLLSSMLLFPHGTWADGVNVFADLTYSNSSTKLTNPSGITTKTDANSFLQRYNFQIDRRLFPKLRLNMTGIYEEYQSHGDIDGIAMDSKANRFMPSAALTLTDPVYGAGVGYYLREVRQYASQAPTVATISEDYTGYLLWRPEGFPTMDLRYFRSNRYDRDYATVNATLDAVNLSTRYAYGGMELRYAGSYVVSEDKLNAFETTNTLHNGRGNYAGQFLQGRLDVSTSYNINYSETSVEATGAGPGTVSTPLFPLGGGLSLIDTDVLFTPLVVDPSVVSGTANFNIGSTGGTVPVQLGLDFTIPAAVNNIQVEVDGPLPTGTTTPFWNFDIYTSANNTAWQKMANVPGVSVIPLPPLSGNIDRNGFNLTFPPPPATRYIKVVVLPLPLNANIPNVIIKNVQAFTQETISTATRQTLHNTTQNSNSLLRYRILNVPFVYYESAYSLTRKSNAPSDVSTLSNGFSASHSFNEKISGTARVAREDNTDQTGSNTEYIYQTTLMATPLRTLSHTLTFSGRNRRSGEDAMRSYAVFLNNSAHLYQGVDMNLSGGYTTSEEAIGSTVKSTQFSLGANIEPHRTLTMALYVNDSRTQATLPRGQESSTDSRSLNISLAYNPVPTVYLTAMILSIDSGEGFQTTQNYGFFWSPFPDGALQFRFSFTEDRQPVGQTVDRSISYGARYKINMRSYADITYQSTQTLSAFQTVDADYFSINLKLYY